ncbi:MAG: VCBS repeat-containing protein [Anaerolineae bacterium]|nr:VCBS repeat-containing protein [Anaerolineae bacterium]
MIPKFQKHIIATIENDIPPGAMNTFMASGDLNNNGRIDLIVSGRNGRMVWLENQGNLQFVEHIIDAEVHQVECGGSVYDISGNGFLDVLVGSGDSIKAWWWENPGVPDQPWQKHILYNQQREGHVHDTLIGDVMNTGTPMLVTTNQVRPAENQTEVYLLDFPEHPERPWPFSVIGTGFSEGLVDAGNSLARMQPEEGLAIGDLTGDSRNEIVMGNHWFQQVDGKWEAHRFSTGYVTAKIALADLDCDGRLEIILSEGDPVIYGKQQGGRLGWFKPGEDIFALWEEHILDDGLLDAHTLLTADLTGNGHLDILCGEIGWSDAERNYQRREPWILLYENLGDGTFARHILDQGTGIHDGQLVDLTGNGKLDIVSKPLHGEHIWDIVVFAQE